MRPGEIEALRAAARETAAERQAIQRWSGVMQTAARLSPALRAAWLAEPPQAEARAARDRAMDAMTARAAAAATAPAAPAAPSAAES
jgi:hypothetical protein